MQQKREKSARNESRRASGGWNTSSWESSSARKWVRSRRSAQKQIKIWKNERHVHASFFRSFSLLGFLFFSTSRMIEKNIYWGIYHCGEASVGSATLIYWYLFKRWDKPLINASLHFLSGPVMVAVCARRVNSRFSIIRWCCDAATSISLEAERNREREGNFNATISIEVSRCQQSFELMQQRKISISEI